LSAKRGRLIPVPETFFLLDRATEILDQVDDLKQLLKIRWRGKPDKNKCQFDAVFWEPFPCRASFAEILRKYPKGQFSSCGSRVI
jgi:hypothetical protein